MRNERLGDADQRERHQGINTHVDGPEGAPWLVLSNSLMTNLTMWERPRSPELKKSYRILR